MNHRVILLLNLAVLVVNFFVSLGATETQTRVLRTTARVAFSQPLVPPMPRPRPAPMAPAPTAREPSPMARLVKFLARSEELDRLTPAQVDALYLAHDHCRHELEEGGVRLRGAAYGGAHTRRLLGDLRARVRRNVEDTFRAAEVSDREVLARLVRVVLASAG
ncbi:MAG: hypothetical protein ACYTDU_15485 [Planctomycetota bacterium]|jgi:hypothetical protein